MRRPVWKTTMVLEVTQFKMTSHPREVHSSIVVNLAVNAYSLEAALSKSS